MGFFDRLSRRLDELAEDLLPGDLRDSIDGARDLLERGQAAAAATALEATLVAKPDHATALYLLGLARLRLADPERAKSAFARALAARAGFSEAAVGEGSARLALGDAAGAIPLFRQVIAEGAARETLAEAYRGLGRAYLATGAAEKGLRELRKALAEDPDDADAAVALAEALLAANLDAEEARAPLERLAEPPAPALAALGKLELRAGRPVTAEKTLLRALVGTLDDSARAAALSALADALIARGDDRGAHERILRALAITPRDPALALRLARLHARAQSPDAALDAYTRAADLGAGPAVLDEALALAVTGGLTTRALPLAARLLAVDPGHPLARGVRLAADGDRAGAREVLGQAGGSIAAALLAARLELDDGHFARAAAAALAVLRRDPGCAAARRLLFDASRGELGLTDTPEPPSGDVVAVANRLHRLTRTTPLADLGDLAPEAARALAAYDRPLLVTVMGEFSSGKSTFVNAFVGADVAPVGITPTTATINVLTYGREPGARIVYRDDRVRELSGAELTPILAGIDADEARRIRQVEVLYPLDELLRVNIVDTPGLNSILPEHEATAREFIAQADAVIWLFSAGQAGKASEREALEKIRDACKRVLGVVNKIDQASAKEVGPLLAFVQSQLGELVEALVPVSARAALAARRAHDEAGIAASSWPALSAALEERFFKQARALKRAALTRRLAALLAEARARAAAAESSAQARRERCRTAANQARADAAIFEHGVVGEERQALAERLATAHRAAARDVLELVRPRKTPFGANSASVADRDYLLGFLDRNLAAAIEPARIRVVSELRRAAGDAAAAVADPEAARAIAAHVDDAVTLVEARVFERARAYLRGQLRGGHVDDFFARVLPKLELTEDSVYHALIRDAPDLEAELMRPLAEQGTQALRAIAARLDALAGAAEVDRLAADTLTGALDALQVELDARPA